jgi:hypothetical protein
MSPLGKPLTKAMPGLTPGTGRIWWDLNEISLIHDNDCNGNMPLATTPTLNLAHEIYHIYNILTGRYKYGQSTDAQYAPRNSGVSQQKM